MTYHDREIQAKRKGRKEETTTNIDREEEKYQTQIHTHVLYTDKQETYKKKVTDFLHNISQKPLITK